MHLDNKKIIIFGASNGGIKISRFLLSRNIETEFFLDNDEKKWGMQVEGKLVKNPLELENYNLESSVIVIGSMYEQQIRKQLKDNGILDKYILSSSDIFLYYIKQDITKILLEKTSITLNTKNQKKTLLLTLPNSFITGGIETWTTNLYKLLKKDEINTKIISLSHNKGIVIPDQYVEDTLNFYPDYGNYFELIKDIIGNIVNFVPCTIIPNNSEEVFHACYCLKSILGDFVNVVSVIHGDSSALYDQNVRYSGIISKFICVSDEIAVKMKSILSERDKDIISRISFVDINYHSDKVYSISDAPINIGYVGRLVREDKRCDNLLTLLEQLEKADIDYNFHIAGTGLYYDIIQSFVKTKGIGDKVFLYGFIQNNEIESFWKDKDIYVNVSEREGTCISMLEAMGSGIVPVVTNVSGVSKVIAHNFNGYVVDVNDLNSMTNYIVKLYKNRSIISQYGRKSAIRIHQICNSRKYLEFIKKTCAL